MGDDASLEDFLDVDDEHGDAASTDTDPARESNAGRAASTYAWAGDGGVCDACGETVERRWCDGTTLVCPNCKDW